VNARGEIVGGIGKSELALSILYDVNVCFRS
jgi:hypothetical protein